MNQCHICGGYCAAPPGTLGPATRSPPPNTVISAVLIRYVHRGREVGRRHLSDGFTAGRDAYQICRRLRSISQAPSGSERLQAECCLTVRCRAVRGGAGRWGGPAVSTGRTLGPLTLSGEAGQVDGCRSVVSVCWSCRHSVSVTAAGLRQNVDNSARHQTASPAPSRERPDIMWTALPATDRLAQLPTGDTPDRCRQLCSPPNG